MYNLKKMLSCNLISNCSFWKNTLKLYCTVPLPDIDIDYYCNAQNASEIKENIGLRKGIGDINRVLNIYNTFLKTPREDECFQSLREDLYKELNKLPNRTHPAVQRYQEQAHVVNEVNGKKSFGDYSPLEFSEITDRLNLMRTDKLGLTCGNKSYYYFGDLAELEVALIKYTVTALLRENFQLVSVPDILSSNILQSCGMAINSDRTQIYSLDPVHHGPDLYLSGTAEMSLAGLLINSIHDEAQLPIKLAAVSRCYRAETSNLIEEKGTYRVHQFTKVEMFAVTTPDQSEEMLEYLRKTQEALFAPLDIHLRILDMPPYELGAPAYRKYDIEAWMPGRGVYGEISSCSNCTDYQSRRLNIKWLQNGINKYVHTLNGTACAVPRMLIALLETHQDPKGKIFIPTVLQSFMLGRKFISKNSNVPKLKLLKVKK